MIDTALATLGINIITDPAARWKIVGLRELTPSENHGNHHIYVDVANADGTDARRTSLQLRYGWEGMREDEAPPLVPLDKPEGEPAANVPIWKGMRAWVEVAGERSERVSGLRTDYTRESDTEGSSWGHRSFAITFQRQEALG